MLPILTCLSTVPRALYAILSRFRMPSGSPATAIPLPSSAPRPPTLLINCLANNIHIALSDSATGRLLFKLSSGTVGMKGSAKCSPKATLAIMDALQAKLAERGVPEVRVNFRGVSVTRALLIHQLKRVGVRITEVMDSTRIPFNGCRPRKSKRL